MSNPGFSVGELVAVWSLRHMFAIPSTTITKYCGLFQRGDSLLPHVDGTARTSGHYYSVYGCVCLHEQYLRKISPGEYTEDTQDFHAPIEEGAQ